MSGPWVVEYDDEGGLDVISDDDRSPTMQAVVPCAAYGHPTELAAWRNGLESLLVRRDYLASHIKEARRNIRRRATANQ